VLCGANGCVGGDGVGKRRFSVDGGFQVCWCSVDGCICLQEPLGQCFSTFVRPRPGKFSFHKTRARSEQIHS